MLRTNFGIQYFLSKLLLRGTATLLTLISSVLMGTGASSAIIASLIAGEGSVATVILIDFCSSCSFTGEWDMLSVSEISFSYMIVLIIK